MSEKPLPKPSDRLGIYLDLSKNATGWCVAVGRNDLIDHGVWEFAKRRDGQVMADFAEVLDDLILTYKPEVLVYENAMMQRGRAGEIFYAMVGVMKLVAHWYDVPVFQVSPNSLKKWGAGNGKASKQDVIRAVNERHHLSLTDDNEADAIALVEAAWRMAIYDELRRAA